MIFLNIYFSAPLYVLVLFRAFLVSTIEIFKSKTSSNPRCTPFSQQEGQKIGLEFLFLTNYILRTKIFFFKSQMKYKLKGEIICHMIKKCM